MTDTITDPCGLKELNSTKEQQFKKNYDTAKQPTLITIELVGS